MKATTKNTTMMACEASRWKMALLALLMAAPFLLPRQARAQQDPQYTQYMFNLLALNPAYPGSADRVSIKALSRHQWAGFEGAPTTQTRTVHGPLACQGRGRGGTVMRHGHGPVTQYGVVGDVAYRMFLPNDQKLAFGIK